MTYTFREVESPKLEGCDVFRAAHAKRVRGELRSQTTIGVFQNELLVAHFYVNGHTVPQVAVNVLPQWCGNWTAADKAQSIADFNCWVNPEGLICVEFCFVYLSDTEYPNFEAVLDGTDLKWFTANPDDAVRFPRPKEGYGTTRSFSNHEHVRRQRQKQKRLGSVRAWSTWLRQRHSAA